MKTGRINAGPYTFEVYVDESGLVRKNTVMVGDEATLIRLLSGLGMSQEKQLIAPALVATQPFKKTLPTKGTAKLDNLGLSVASIRAAMRDREWSLSKEQSAVVRYRAGIGLKHSYSIKATAKALNISQESVKRIFESSIKTLGIEYNPILRGAALINHNKGKQLS